MGVYLTIWCYSFHLHSISADTKPFQVPIGYFGIYIAFPLLRFQALLGIERFLDGSGSGRNDEEQKKKESKTGKNPMSSLHSLSSFSIFCAKAL